MAVNEKSDGREECSEDWEEDRPTPTFDMGAWGVLQHAAEAGDALDHGQDLLMDEPPLEEESERFPMVNQPAAPIARINLVTADDTAQALRLVRGEAMNLASRFADTEPTAVPERVGGSLHPVVITPAFAPAAGAASDGDMPATPQQHAGNRGAESARQRNGSTGLARIGSWAIGLALSVAAGWWIVSSLRSVPLRAHEQTLNPSGLLGGGVRKSRAGTLPSSSAGLFPFTAGSAPETPRSDLGDAAMMPVPPIARRAEPPATSFDRDLARAALQAAAPRASRCRQRGDPTGIARVTVTFEPGGRAHWVRVLQGPFKDTNTALCIEARMADVSVPAFKGGRATISHPIRVF